MALNITVASYDDQREVGMVSDGETITDLWELVDAICGEFDDLHAAVSVPAAR